MSASASTTVARREGDRAEALARLWSRVRLPLVAAPVGGLVAVAGCYLYWTLATIQVEGVPMTGFLVDFGFGGVRRWALLLAIASLAYGGFLLLRRQPRTGRQGEALARLGLGLTVVPLLWMVTLVTFLNAELSQIGPGPWVTAAGGALV